MQDFTFIRLCARVWHALQVFTSNTKMMLPRALSVTAGNTLLEQVQQFVMHVPRVPLLLSQEASLARAVGQAHLQIQLG